MKARLIFTCVALLALAGCVSDGQSVIISKGQASGLGRLLGASGEYCKVTASQGVTITEEDRKAAREYCKSDSEKIIDRLQGK